MNLAFTPKGVGSSWFLERVELDYLGTTLVFPHKEWLKTKTMLELAPDRDGDGIGDAKEALDLVQYRVCFCFLCFITTSAMQT